MTLTHWAASPFELDRSRKYVPAHNDPYFKPSGLWFEVDGDWQRWCETEDFGAERRKVAYDLQIDSSNFLVMPENCGLEAFTGKYGTRKDGFSRIDWPRVQREYSGIIIAPYCWYARLELSWYYSWDCASGCVWNLSKLLRFGLILGEVNDAAAI